MFTSNNLSIIDETGRSDVMAAAIPATNKWLLTKQASVALSGLWDDRHGAEQSIEKQEARGAKREAEHWTLLLTWASRGLEKAQRAETVPWWKVVDTPLRSLQDKQEVNESEKEKGGGKWHSEVRATAWNELSAVGQLSALLSSLGFMSDTIYLAVKPRQPTHSPPTITPIPSQIL